ncbi:MAG: DUF262 domain-containing protein [bacterium]
MADDDLELVDEADDSASLPFRYSITAYGADMLVDGLVRRLKDKSIDTPRFQRGYVWSYKDACRFIESLLLGLPVPSVFLSKDDESQRFLVIDGQQRLKTLLYFYTGIFEPTAKKFVLQDVQEGLEGKSYETLPVDLRRKLDDSIIHAIIVKQDEPTEDRSSIYQIFERLNTGGMTLHSQEIRACIYDGEFNDLLKELNTIREWREIVGPVSSRMKDQELILRFLALRYDRATYSKPMKLFLNGYMGRNRHLKLQSRDQLVGAFRSAIETANRAFGKGAFRPQRTLNAAAFDAVMVGISERLKAGPITDHHALRAKYDLLLLDPKFSEAITSSTSAEKQVHERIERSVAAFSKVA